MNYLKCHFGLIDVEPFNSSVCQKAVWYGIIREVEIEQPLSQSSEAGKGCGKLGSEHPEFRVRSDQKRQDLLPVGQEVF